MLTNQLKVSIIIPTFNRSVHVAKAIQSVLNQDYFNLEIIVVDDCSTDDTIIKLSEIRDVRLKLIKLSSNSGPQVSRNVGLREAKGFLIMFLDSDDEFVQGSILKRIELFEKNQIINVLIVGYWMQILDNLRAIKKAEILKGWRDGNVYNKMLHTLALSPTSTLTVKRKCLLEIGCFDEKLLASQDDDILIRLSKKFDFYFLHEPLIKINSTNIDRVSTNPYRYAKGYHQVIEKYLQEILLEGGIVLLLKHYGKIAAFYMRAMSYNNKKNIFNKSTIIQKPIIWLFYIFYLATYFLKDLLKNIYYKITYEEIK